MNQPANVSNVDPDRPSRPFSTFRSTGVLWALNRHVFHPRGLALALVWDLGVDPDTAEPTGWVILGDGAEVWAYEHGTDERGFAAFGAFLEEVLA